MAILAELSASELAQHANNVFMAWGRHPAGAQLIYRALQLDARQLQALRCLSDFHDHKGTERFSAVTLEYALSGAVQRDQAQQRSLERLKILMLWGWGFSKHRSGQVQLPGEAFERPQDFEVDLPAYQAFLNDLLGPLGSLETACRAAWRLSGVMGGFLKHRTASQVGLEELMDLPNLLETPAFHDWLKSSAEPLDDLARSLKTQRP